MTKESLKTIYITYRMVIFPSVVVFSCLILIFFVIYPQISGLIGNYRQEEQLRSKFKIMEAKAQTLENFDAEDLSGKLALALNSYPADRDYPNIIGLIQSIVRRFNFNIVSMQLSGGSSQQKKSASSSSYSVRMELKGPRMLLKDLISGIENSPRVMKISGIELSSIKSEETAGVNMSIEVYYQSLPGTFGSADSPLPAISEQEEEILTVLARLPGTSGPKTIAVPKGRVNPFE